MLDAFRSLSRTCRRVVFEDRVCLDKFTGFDSNVSISTGRLSKKVIHLDVKILGRSL